ELAKWIEAEVAFPCSMVDSITPATDDALRARVADALGVQDRWPIQREAFCQWVIEDTFRGPTPDWASIGVTVTNDVAGFERAKWSEAEVAFPCSMVDSITPATDDALRARVADALGVQDRWPIQREAFCQWVIEDTFRGPTPDWASIGVTVTNDVAGFERA